MYHTHFLSKNPEKIKIYKKYANTLTHLKNKSKTGYYSSQFLKHKDNLKSTWKLIGNLIKRKTKGQSLPTRITCGNNTYTDVADIADQFNNFFANVGPNLASKIKCDQITKEPTQYINKSPSSSFILSPVTESQVFTLFANLNEDTAYINIPNKFNEAK